MSPSGRDAHGHNIASNTRHAYCGELEGMEVPRGLATFGQDLTLLERSLQ